MTHQLEAIVTRLAPSKTAEQLALYAAKVEGSTLRAATPKRRSGVDEGRVEGLVVESTALDDQDEERGAQLIQRDDIGVQEGDRARRPRWRAF